MEWDKDLRDTLLIHKLILRFIGVWPVKERDLLMDFRWIVALFLELFPMSVHFGKIYLRCHGLKESLDSITPGAAAALALARLIAPRLYRRELLEIITAMIEDWSTHKDERVRDIMRRHSGLSTRVTKSMGILVGLIIGVYASYAVSAILPRKESTIANNASFLLSEADRERGSKGSCILDDPPIRRTIALVQGLQMFLTGALTFSTTSLFFALAMHISGQFEVLAAKFEKKSDAREMVGEVVRRHCRLIRLTDFLESSFNASILVYLFVTALLMIFEGFLLIIAMKLENPSKIIHHASVLSLMLIQLSFYTFAGDYLETRSGTLTYSIYNYDWYELPAYAVKDVRIILTRASIPHELTAGKFVTLNMITFKDILRSTASYLSVLRVIMGE
ncbi:hypothetical protein KM043_006102 [Ampulex compressa]|nr:hypothetical protein KM043_006102 [Ampulex compressa]